MIITNATGLPDALTKLYAPDEEVDDKRIGIPALLAPAPQSALLELNKATLKEDIADDANSLLSLALFRLIGHADARFELSADLCGRKVSAVFDAGHSHSVYKIASAYKFAKGDFDDYEKEAEIRAFLLSTSGPVVAKKDAPGAAVMRMEVISLIKDWSQRDLEAALARGGCYPAHSVMKTTYDIPFSSLPAVQDWIEGRIAAINKCKAASPEAFAPCSEEERWKDPDKFAIYKKADDKRAAKVCDTEEEAKTALTEAFKGVGVIQTRKGANKRCLYYCDAKGVCPFHKQEEAAEGKKEN